MQEKEMDKTILITLKEILIDYSNSIIFLLLTFLVFFILIILVLLFGGKKDGINDE